MKVVETYKYDFCNVCHVFGCTSMIEFKAVLPQGKEPVFNICKNCAEEISQLSKEIKE